MSTEAPHPSREDVFAYRDGELTAERRVLIEAHVVTCRFCRELIDQVSALEADLKGRPDAVDDAYFDRLTENVLRRVSAEARPRAERRRSESAPAPIEGGARPKPRLFWPAVVSTATAAAAILVVVLLVVKEDRFGKSMAPIATIEESAPDAGRARSRAADSVVAAAPPAPAPEARVEAKVKQDAGNELAKEVAGAKKSEADADSRAKDQVARMQAAPQSAAPPPAPAAEGLGAAASRQDEGGLGGTSPEFASIRNRYGLPPDWGPAVSDEMVLRAEGPLRNLYRTGGATTATDSARVRLYLAEAARTRAGSAPDSTAIDEIAHHYRRVIRLAGPESETGRIAAERLADFLREVGITP